MKFAHLAALGIAALIALWYFRKPSTAPASATATATVGAAPPAGIPSSNTIDPGALIPRDSTDEDIWATGGVPL